MVAKALADDIPVEIFMLTDSHEIIDPGCLAEKVDHKSGNDGGATVPSAVNCDKKNTCSEPTGDWNHKIATYLNDAKVAVESSESVCAPLVTEETKKE